VVIWNECVPDWPPLALIELPPEDVETRKAFAEKPEDTTKYVVPAVTPLGSDPVVEKTTRWPIDRPCAVLLKVAGLPVVMVTVGELLVDTRKVLVVRLVGAT
jgi:hypothetical protein